MPSHRSSLWGSRSMRNPQWGGLPGMSSVYDPYAQPSDPQLLKRLEKAKFEPSRSVRDLMAERILELIECLNAVINEQLVPLHQAAINGAGSGSQGPGDILVDGPTAACITDNATHPSLRGPLPTGDGKLIKLYNKDGTAKAPMMRYEQLQQELGLLFDISGAPWGIGSNPFGSIIRRTDDNGLIDMLQPGAKMPKRAKKGAVAADPGTPAQLQTGAPPDPNPGMGYVPPQQMPPQPMMAPQFQIPGPQQGFNPQDPAVFMQGGGGGA